MEKQELIIIIISIMLLFASAIIFLIILNQDRDAVNLNKEKIPNENQNCLDLSLTRSEDVIFENNIYDKLTGPSIIKEDGKYLMWFKCTEKEKDRGLCFSTSFDGISWNEPKKIFNFTKIDGGGTPSTIKMGDMYYVYFREDSKDKEGISLITFNGDYVFQDYTKGVFGINPDSWDSKIIAGMDVIKMNNIFYLYYRGSKYLNQMESDIGLATSKDGINWERYGNDPILNRINGNWDQDLLADPDILRIENIFYMFYSGKIGNHTSEEEKDAIGRGKKIGLATSKDGINWERCFNKPLIEEFDKADNAETLYEIGKLKIWFRYSEQEDGWGGDLKYHEYDIIN